MPCARDRLLLILAERAASVHGLAEPDRTPFMAAYISEWRAALYDAYAGDCVRFTVSPASRESRAERDSRITAALAAGSALREIAQREHVSVSLVKLIRKRGQMAA